jgi:hypothetical protein
MSATIPFMKDRFECKASVYLIQREADININTKSGSDCCIGLLDQIPTRKYKLEKTPYTGSVCSHIAKNQPTALLLQTQALSHHFQIIHTILAMSSKSAISK